MSGDSEKSQPVPAGLWGSKDPLQTEGTREVAADGGRGREGQRRQEGGRGEKERKLEKEAGRFLLQKDPGLSRERSAGQH